MSTYMYYTHLHVVLERLVLLKLKALVDALVVVGDVGHAHAGQHGGGHMLGPPVLGQQGGHAGGGGVGGVSGGHMFELPVLVTQGV